MWNDWPITFGVNSEIYHNNGSRWLPKVGSYNTVGLFCSKPAGILHYDWGARHDSYGFRSIPLQNNAVFIGHTCFLLHFYNSRVACYLSARSAEPARIVCPDGKHRNECSGRLHDTLFPEGWIIRNGHVGRFLSVIRSEQRGTVSYQVKSTCIAIDDIDGSIGLGDGSAIAIRQEKFRNLFNM